MTDKTIDQPHESEISRRLAEASYYAAEADKFRAETREAAAKAEAAELYLRGQQRKEKLELIADHYVHHHFFNGPVDDRSVFAALNAMAAWDRISPGKLNEDGTVAEEGCPMNLTVNSPGGGLIDGMHLFDQIASYSLRGGGTHKVTITVRGYAASMGGILLQAADVRLIGRESYLMVHEISAGTVGSIGSIKDDVKWYEKACQRIENIFVERSGGKIGLEEFQRRWSRHDWWVDSAEAVELGFVDGLG